MKKIILIVIAIIVVGGLVLLWQNQNSQAPTSQEINPELRSSTDGSNTLVASNQQPGDVAKIDLVVLLNSGYITIFSEKDGQPDQLLGRSSLIIGDNKDLMIPLTQKIEPGEALLLRLHSDDGDGIYQYPGPDVPIVDDKGEEIALTVFVEGQAEPGTQTDNSGGPDATDTSSDQGTAAEHHVVIYSNSGYDPAEITIKKGDSVTFRNTSSFGMWTASAVHPTHTVYPGSSITKCGTSEAETIFDSCVGTPAGQDWTFTFNEAGTWGYHNHLRPQHFGKVIVE